MSSCPLSNDSHKGVFSSLSFPSKSAPCSNRRRKTSSKTALSETRCKGALSFRSRAFGFASCFSNNCTISARLGLKRSPRITLCKGLWTSLSWELASALRLSSPRTTLTPVKCCNSSRWGRVYQDRRVHPLPSWKPSVRLPLVKGIHSTSQGKTIPVTVCLFEIR